MSPASKSKSKDKKSGKEPQQKAASKPSGHANSGSGVPVSGYNPLLGKFHTLETAPMSSAPPLHINGRFRNIEDTDDHSGNSLGTGTEYDTVSNNGSWSGESEDHKEKTSHQPPRQEAIPGADNDKREKIRQKNEKKHQRQKEKRAQELHERCSTFLMSRKLEALAQQLVAMGFSSERSTMALILNEGKIEESVAWLFEGEEADNHQGHNVDEGNLKIDISEELARIADMEIRYKCSKQEVERAIVACEGDLEKAAETLRVPKQDLPSAPPKPEETGDPPTVSNGKLSISSNQNLLRAQQKPYPPTIVQQRRDEKDFNYTKATATAGVPVELGGKNVQPLRKAQPKLDVAKPQQIPVPADKRWPNMVSIPSVSYSLQATPPLAKPETRYVALGSELKTLQLGSVKEPVVVMQRPQSINLKQAPTTTASISSSPPGTTSGWYPNMVEVSKPNGLAPHISSTRSLAPPSNSSSNQLYNQFQYQQHHQYLSNGGPVVESLGASRGNGLWNRTGTSPTLAAASSLGLFSGLGSNGSAGSGSSSPVDWSTGGGSTHQFDYTNIDWTLDRSSSIARATGMWQQGTTTTSMQNTHAHESYDSYASRPNARTSTRPALANGGGGGGGSGGGGGGGGGGGVPISGFQDGVGSGEMSGSGSREWSSPFEEKDLFSLPRQFVSSPSL